MEQCKTSKCSGLRCASVVDNNDFDLVCESAKGDQHREMILYKTVVESIGSRGRLSLDCHLSDQHKCWHVSYLLFQNFVYS